MPTPAVPVARTRHVCRATAASRRTGARPLSTGPAAALALVLGAILPGCSLFGETATDAAATTPTDATGDSPSDGGTSPADGAGPAKGTGADWKCPGGHGCPCTDDASCTVSGHCVVLAADVSQCAAPCPEGACPAPQRCGWLEGTGGGAGAQKGTGWFCVPPSSTLCNPCGASAQCSGAGLGAACVSYGADGWFCGVACQGDADCGEGYQCAQVERREGGSAPSCVRAPEAGKAGFGVCPCSEAAAAQGLATLCYAVGSPGCKGKRACSGAGLLGACSAVAPAAEVCNGKDDDCDSATDEGTCDDGNGCTKDACAPGGPTAGADGCVHEAVNGSACSDGNACTAGDKCADKKCAPGAPPVCNDGNACSLDKCDTAKGCVGLFDTPTACDADGNPCTQNDQCEGGVCRAGNLLTCDDKLDCTADSCNPKSGACVAVPVEGHACSDGDPCTLGDVCKGSTCAGVADPCDDKNVCTTDSCDKAKGCVLAPDSTAVCDDGNGCTTADACKGGKCQGGAPKNCGSGGVCTTGVCNPVGGACGVAAKAEGTACDDGNKCTTGDGCATGACAGGGGSCNDNNACTDDACDPGAGCANKPNKATCSDGNACTDADKCATGKCTGTAKDVAVACDDKKDCTANACDAKLGCTNPPKTGACEDGNPCTTADACDQGACKAGANTCTCANSADCTAKDDGDLCNGTLVCDTALTTPVCVPDAKSVVVCTTTGDGPCEVSSCDANSGVCAAKAKADGAPCDDSSVCTASDACAGGKCAGAAKDCDDMNACTDEACDAKTGCTNLANTATCDSDASACTADACKDKACGAGPAKTCDDKDPCTADACDKATGACTAPAATDGGACQDGDACTENDACKGGKCVGVIPPSAVSVLAGGTQGFLDAKGELARLDAPRAIALDAAGVAYVADFQNHRVRAVAVDGSVTTFAGGIVGFADGAAASAKFRRPGGVTVAPDGTVWVADTWNQRIRKIVAGSVTTVAGDADDPGVAPKAAGDFADGQGKAAKFNEPYGLAWDPTAAALFVADSLNHRIRKVLPDGTVTTLAGAGTAGFGDGAAGVAQFNMPLGLARLANGTLVVADSQNHRLRAVAADGSVTTLAGTGTAGFKNGAAADSQWSAPFGLATGGDGTTLYVCDAGNHALRTLAGGLVSTLAGLAGQSGFVGGTFDVAKFNDPAGIAVVGPGTWLVADTVNHRIRRLIDPPLACKK
ncbi:MAG: hypothetical protein EXR79_05400 [Myxococcales bacterium]|nr:hypothetical protein [Myxococcales bacterium]